MISKSLTAFGHAKYLSGSTSLTFSHLWATLPSTNTTYGSGLASRENLESLAWMPCAPSACTRRKRFPAAASGFIFFSILVNADAASKGKPE
uniref:Uncharacterized protein n=1 Tax=Globisporangium ultimum (strain ATCC 200006 / CBS 805.95 / DAOM BR144) TaxID=431595 RepID=K3X618_GLOUD